MKIAPRQADRFVAQPPSSLRAALIYGSDGGLARDRAAVFEKAILGDAPDPMQITDLEGAALGGDAARLVDELNAIAMFGGRRLILIRAAEDRNAKAIAAALDQVAGDSILLALADDLSPRAALRKLFEDRADAAAILCPLADAGELAEAIRARFAALDVQADRDAIAYLADRGGDRGPLLQEVEKIALYVGPGGKASLKDMAQIVSDAAAVGLDALAFACADGRASVAMAALDRLLAEGVAPIAALRALGRHYQRVLEASVGVAGGASPDEAVSRLKPPVFFKQKTSFVAQAKRFSEPRRRRRLDHAITAIRGAEAASKRTGAAPASLLRALVLDLSQTAVA